MFRTSYVHRQEDYIVHAALYVMCFIRLNKQYTRLMDLFDVQVTVHRDKFLY